MNTETVPTPDQEQADAAMETDEAVENVRIFRRKHEGREVFIKQWTSPDGKSTREQFIEVDHNDTEDDVVDARIRQHLDRGEPNVVSMPERDTDMESGFGAIQHADLYVETDVALKDVRQSVLPKLTVLAILLAVALGFMGYHIKIPQQLNLKIFLEGEGRQQVIKFDTDTVIEEVFVSVNERVRSGEPLVRIRSAATSDLMDRLERARQQRLQFQAQEPSRQKAKELLNLDIKKQSLIVGQKQGDLTRKKDLARGGLISQVDVTLAEAGLQQAAVELEIALTRLRQKEDADEETLKALLREESRILNTINSQFGDFEVNRGSLVLLASLDGIISHAISNRETHVEPGRIIVKIWKGDPRIVASGAVPPDKIGLFHDNQPVRVKLDAFPHYDWGMMTGRISNLSRTPDEKGNFPFMVELTTLARLQDKLQIGMTGDVSLMTSEKSIVGHLFERVHVGLNTLQAPDKTSGALSVSAHQK